LDKALPRRWLGLLGDDASSAWRFFLSLSMVVAAVVVVVSTSSFSSVTLRAKPGRRRRGQQSTAGGIVLEGSWYGQSIACNVNAVVVISRNDSSFFDGRRKARIGVVVGPLSVEQRGVSDFTAAWEADVVGGGCRKKVAC